MRLLWEASAAGTTGACSFLGGSARVGIEQGERVADTVADREEPVDSGEPSEEADLLEPKPAMG